MASSAKHCADEVVPDAPSLIGSLRASGYDLDAALADIIDNSISAEARNVQVVFGDDGTKSWIAVVDDGSGMDEKRLVTAMTLGGINPEEERSPTDLGRFGLGLKTASFSQCRRLTVLTRCKGGKIYVRCWDIDVVNETHRWTLLRDPVNESLAKRFGGELQKKESGTVVLWEKLDRIVHESDEDEASRRLLGRIPGVERHIGLVFQRYLSPLGALKLRIGDADVNAIDPFMDGLPARQVLGQEVLECQGRNVIVTPYVLPHISKLNRNKYGGDVRDWTARQGFYVYRNERLLAGATWLNLGFGREDNHKLARIRIDFPNDLDFAWDINIRKSRAVPPEELREDLRRIAKKTRDESRRIYRHRGAAIARDFSEKQFMWERLVARGKFKYRINRSHPVIEALLSATERSAAGNVLRNALRLIEETVPVPLILADGSDDHEAVAAPVDDKLSGEAEQLMEFCFDLLRKRHKETEAFAKLCHTEPFVRYPDLLATFKEKHDIGD
jgi:hypothetical protein